MLPRVATTTGALQPSLALQAGASVDAAVKPQLSTAALANLRAEVLLRLIETMLKHMPRTGEASPSRDLLETLLTALKTLPGHDGENGRKLADIIAKLPPELRPSVEKLIGTVLSSMPTRGLVEIVRNPNGPEAQKLANLLATSLTADDLPAAGAERQQKPVGLTAQQLAAVGRHGTQQPLTTQGDARALQTTLKRIFDLESGKPRPLPGQATDVDTDHQLPVGTNRLPTGGNAPVRAEARLPSPAVLLPGDEQAVEAPAALIRHGGETEEAEATAPAAKREDVPVKTSLANATGQALARSVLQAVARDVPPAVLMQVAAQLMENLSPEEASFLRALLERPLDPATEQALALIQADQPDEAEAAAAQAGKARPETAQSASALPQPETDQGEPLPIAHTRDGAQAAALADTTPDRLLPAAVLREGVPLAFIPYLPAEEDLEWPAGRERDEDEAGDEDAPDGEDEGGGEAQDGNAGDEPADEPETPDMARRREKTADMVGVIEPGLVFYQKLGDYWT